MTIKTTIDEFLNENHKHPDDMTELELKQADESRRIAYIAFVKFQNTLVKQLIKDLEKRYPVDLEMYYVGSTGTVTKNAIILEKIFVRENNRNSGVGTSVMQEICDFADEHWINIALTPGSDYGSSRIRLTDFYTRFGFEKYRGTDYEQNMLRLYKGY